MKKFILPFGFLILPLIFWPFLFNSTELAKVIFFRVLIELLVAFYWLKIINQITFFFSDKKKNLLGFLVIGYFFWAFLSSLMGVSWRQSLFGNYFRQQGLFTLLHFVLLFLLVILLSRQIKKDFFALFISLGAFLASFWALFQAVPKVLAGNLFPEVAGTFGNPNFLGGYLVITLPFSFYLVKKKKFFLPFALVQILAIIFSGSRIAIFLLLMTFCFLLSFYFKKRWLFWLPLLILLLALLSFSKEGSFYESRLRIWPKALLAIKERPISGWGLENFEFAFDAVLVPEKDIGLTGVRVDKAHNEFLEVLVAGGLIGFCLYLLIIILALRILWQQIKRAKDKEWWLVIFLSLVLFLLRSQVNPVSIAEQAFFWFLIGLTADFKTGLKIKPFPARSFLSLVVFCGLTLMIIFNFRSFWADFLFKKGTRIEATDYPTAEKFFKKAYQVFPWEEFYYVKTQQWK